MILYLFVKIHYTAVLLGIDHSLYEVYLIYTTFQVFVKQWHLSGMRYKSAS